MSGGGSEGDGGDDVEGGGGGGGGVWAHIGSLQTLLKRLKPEPRADNDRSEGGERWGQ